VEIKKHPKHVPIGLLAHATLRNDIKEGQEITFDDVSLPESLALDIWKEIVFQVS